MSEVAAQRKLLKLRYAGSCSRCGSRLPAGTAAVYHRSTKTIACRDCVDADGHAIPGAVRPACIQNGPNGAAPDLPAASGLPARATEPEVDAGVAGASARREQLRRQARREQRIRARHPRLGGLILAISNEPQSTNAWGVGATGEEMLGAGFDRLASRGVRVLHDRRIPGSKTNIDHILVTWSGVYVVDAKRYRGLRPRLQVDGGLLRARTERLLVGTRDRTALVTGIHKQVEVVTRALDYLANGRPVPPVSGVLCFIDADWPLIGGSFTINEIHVEWPKKTYTRLTGPGPLNESQIQAWHAELAGAFPRA